SKSVIAMMQGRKPQTMPERNGGSVSITRREEQILHLVARGLTSPQIAEKLSISSRTVETHRANLMDKTGASNMAGLVRYALLHAAYFSES
ncbi:MAG: response regulator transcription factor, partial [Candidatus Kapaibacterium sp.]